jgi:hypothetical protein
MFVSVRVRVRMRVAVAAGTAELVPARKRNPAAEPDQRQARQGIDEVSEAVRHRLARKPGDERDNQRRGDVAAAGQRRSARRLGLRPARWRAIATIGAQ